MDRLIAQTMFLKNGEAEYGDWINIRYCICRLMYLLLKLPRYKCLNYAVIKINNCIPSFILHRLVVVFNLVFPFMLYLCNCPDPLRFRRHSITILKWNLFLHNFFCRRRKRRRSRKRPVQLLRWIIGIVALIGIFQCRVLGGEG